VLSSSAKEMLKTKIEGFTLDVDDFFTNPFYLLELLVSIQVIMSRKIFKVEMFYPSRK
jgi:DNA-binding response OmpR family regulator